MKDMRFVVYRSRHIRGLSIGLLDKKTKSGYKIKCPRDAVGIIGCGNMDKLVRDDEVVAIIDREKAIRVYSTMFLLSRQYRDVVRAAEKAMDDAVEIVVKSLKHKEAEDD